MSNYRIKWTLVWAVLLLLILGACSPGGDVAPAEAPDVSAQEASPTAEQVSVEEDEQESAPEKAEPTAVPEDEDEQELKPMPKQGLSATDPTTVDLATGEPVLVEFFAFW